MEKKGSAPIEQPKREPIKTTDPKFVKGTASPDVKK